jgi:hypothetical protein
MNDAKTTRDAKALAAGGALFLAMGGFFLWRDLALPRELLMLVTTIAAGAAAVLKVPRQWPVAAPAALLATTVAAGSWFLGDKSAALLPSLALALAAATAAVMRAARPGEPALAHDLRWYGLGVALLASTSAFYFHFLTVGVAADSVARRLIPTVAWLAVGLALYIAGRRRAPAVTRVGLGLMGVALCKAVVYDTTHLAGGLRTLVLTAVGAMLLFGAAAIRRGSTKEVL